MNLHDRILALKQGHSQYGTNGLLDSFDLEMCKKMDKEAEGTQLGKTTVSDILRLLEGYQVGYDEKLKSACEKYCEYAIYLELRDRNVIIDRIPESATEKRPDFKVSLEDENIYIEAKILGWGEGRLQYDDAIDSGINAQIEIESQIEKGKSIAFGASTYNPLGGGKDAINEGEKFIIEALIKKACNNIKTGQLALGETFILYDLTSLKQFPYPNEESAIVHNLHNPYGSYCSGILWHIAFGKHGDRILKKIEFEGKSNIAGYLEQDGILIRHPELAGIVFRTSGLGTEVKYTALLQSEKFDRHGEFICKIFDYWNDEQNSNAWSLLGAT